MNGKVRGGGCESHLCFSLCSCLCTINSRWSAPRRWTPRSLHAPLDAAAPRRSTPPQPWPPHHIARRRCSRRAMLLVAAAALIRLVAVALSLLADAALIWIRRGGVGGGLVGGRRGVDWNRVGI
ncbi:hypothetical protein PVAP13_7KG048727 [Panicum virgatum]|uniref:Uncharacterized protein n=1 Tax=Panicum virgatum TaxID=38727 RepID=A0A8T0Q945_PANVG|nr:hypothetical protein PVAP13_7KG048727 [Panicum virgatum]